MVRTERPSHDSSKVLPPTPEKNFFNPQAHPGMNARKFLKPVLMILVVLSIFTYCEVAEGSSRSKRVIGGVREKSEQKWRKCYSHSGGKREMRSC